ncbi:type IV pilus modification protein PilV [Halomonas alkaliantarctica]|nr:type IV pilus modification protein PilV [Halomonas alkaliantarctica]
MKCQRGFSLIEALIALLVLSLGLVGVAAMQLKALQSATVGYQRSVVTLAAVDAQERLWAELPQLDSDQDCADVDTATVEAEWQALWSVDETSNPLRNARWGENASRIDETSDCEFKITIVLDDGPGGISTDFDYTFRLPEKP